MAGEAQKPQAQGTADTPGSPWLYYEAVRARPDQYHTTCCDKALLQFPDFERVGWFNDIVGQLWPYINSAVSAMARDQLDPMLQESKPGWIRSIKLYRQGGVRACVAVRGLAWYLAPVGAGAQGALFDEGQPRISR